MRFLVDANVLLRWSDSTAPEHAVCSQALELLLRQSSDICVCAQVIIEYYVVATRPREVNGFGFSAARAEQELADIEAVLPCLPEPADIVVRWRRVVAENKVLGRQAHDARIVAVMYAHGCTHLVTLNTRDFARYHEITPLTPADVLSR